MIELILFLKSVGGWLRITPKEGVTIIRAEVPKEEGLVSCERFLSQRELEGSWVNRDPIGYHCEFILAELKAYLKG
jgi:hypothetical protein